MGGQLAERRERWCWGGRGPGYEPTNKVDSTQRIGDLTIRIWDFPSTLIQSSTGKSYIYIYIIYIYKVNGLVSIQFVLGEMLEMSCRFPQKTVRRMDVNHQKHGFNITQRLVGHNQ